MIEKIKSKTSFPDASEAQRIISGFRWIGLFSKEKAPVRAGNLLDTLCARLEELMKYEEGERGKFSGFSRVPRSAKLRVTDLVMLQHKFEIENKDGSRETRTSTLCEYGAPTGSGGPSAMARLVGIPCAVGKF